MSARPPGGPRERERNLPQHRSCWHGFGYVYPVIGRRSGGLSIGVNLCPDGRCNFNCVYCQIDRTRAPRVHTLDLERLGAELRSLLTLRERIFDEPEFRDVDPTLRRLRDIAFSGDGEPTASPQFRAAVELVVGLRHELALGDTKIVVITNASRLRHAEVEAALELLDHNNGEVWAKLDAGTQAYFEKVNRTLLRLDEIVGNIAHAAHCRPIVIQSMFMAIHGQAPSGHEIEAYVQRLRDLIERGARLKLVQVYTVARRPAEDWIGPLDAQVLEEIAERVRAAGAPAAVYP
ncbi:MAG: radical SAM protein [Phycisphaerae bacterium]|nr:radical SAM protein [Phycisphaerae bacterium]MCZ2398421.1 radical SAM protein [Phycisphaerae bacterium]NUQ50181.1 radical SAM protein [Phycisphaerae bacterium]